MKASLLFILGLLLTTAYVSAIDSLIFVKQIHIQSTQFTTDPVGNVYIVKGNNTLLKYNAKGDSIGFFNEIKKGKITQVDASNPLRILIFLADYGNVLMLDNLLTLKNTLKLNSLGIINATCIANSADGSIWAYDPSGMLMKINNKPEISPIILPYSLRFLYTGLKNGTKFEIYLDNEMVFQDVYLATFRKNGFSITLPSIVRQELEVKSGEIHLFEFDLENKTITLIKEY